MDPLVLPGSYQKDRSGESRSAALERLPVEKPQEQDQSGVCAGAVFIHLPLCFNNETDAGLRIGLQRQVKAGPSLTGTAFNGATMR